jgi:hypothetical protein
VLSFVNFQILVLLAQIAAGHGLYFRTLDAPRSDIRAFANLVTLKRDMLRSRRQISDARLNTSRVQSDS